MNDDFKIKTFNKNLKIFYKKFSLSNKKENILNFFYQQIDNNKKSKNGAYGITRNLHPISDEIINCGLSICKDIAIYENKYSNRFAEEYWINVVKPDPIQRIYQKNNLIFHSHETINKGKNIFIPMYTFVYYVQMPNNLNDKDGVLYIKDVDNNVYDFLPEESMVVVMSGDTLHAPNIAPDSSLDRIVLAGNILFSEAKINKSII